MSTDIKEVVKEKYGQAALRVHSGAVPAAALPPRWIAAAIPSRRIFTMLLRRARFPKMR